MDSRVFFICLIGIMLFVSGCVNKSSQPTIQPNSSQPTSQPNISVHGNQSGPKKVTLYGNVTVNGEIPKAKIIARNSLFANGTPELIMGKITFLEAKDNSPNTFEDVTDFIGPYGDYEIQVNAGEVYPFCVYFFQYGNNTDYYQYLPFKKMSVNNTTRYDINLKIGTPTPIPTSTPPNLWWRNIWAGL